MQDSKHDYPDIFSETSMRLLASGRLKWPDSPWNNRKPKYSFYKALCRDMARKLGISHAMSSYAYDQGYASFAEAFFFKETQDFQQDIHGKRHHAYDEISVVFSLYIPF